MTYEEKLDLILTAIIEARKATRLGQPVRLYYSEDNGLNRFEREEIHDILLQLQDNEKIIAIQRKINRLLPIEKQPIDANYIYLEILISFDLWYENYLMHKKTSLENLTAINVLRIYDTMQDINEQIQLTNNTTVHINILPPLIRYRELFPADTPGFRDAYCEQRLASLKYLKEKDVITVYAHGRNGWDTTISVSFILSKFDEFYKIVKEEYKKRRQPVEQNASVNVPSTNIKEKPKWPEDFYWEGKTFIFGKYGRLSIQSAGRYHILKLLTDKKGGWATINELKGTQNAGYVRSTIKQIEDRLPEEAKKYIKIISTLENNEENKPASGAYRIKIDQ